MARPLSDSEKNELSLALELFYKSGGTSAVIRNLEGRLRELHPATIEKYAKKFGIVPGRAGPGRPRKEEKSYEPAPEPRYVPDSITRLALHSAWVKPTSGGRG